MKFIYPDNYSVKLCDLGNSVNEKEYKDRIINTRQYRAPEVILGSYFYKYKLFYSFDFKIIFNIIECCIWNEKVDIWGLACVILEMINGKIFFNTNDDQEHLALIEFKLGFIKQIN